MLAKHIIILDIMYINNLIKIPTTSYFNATLKRQGHDLLRIRGGIFKPLRKWGKSKCQRENPSKLSTTHFLSFSPIIYLCHKLVEVVIAWEWEEYGQNLNWAKHPFLKNVF